MKRAPRSASPPANAGAQQGLRLPGRGPARVVAGVGLQRSHQRPVASLGAQVGVDPQRRIGGRGGEHRPHPRDDALREPEVIRTGPLGIGRRVDEHDVGVGAVAGLHPAETSHRDDRDADGQAGEALVGGDRVRRRLQRGVEGGLGRGADRLADADDVEPAEQVGERDPQQLVPAQPANDERPPVRRRAGAAPPRPSTPAAARRSAAPAARRRRASATRPAPAAASRRRSDWSPARRPAATRPRPRRAAAAGTTASRPARRTPAGRRAARRRARERRRSRTAGRAAGCAAAPRAATAPTSAPRCGAAPRADRRTRARPGAGRPRPGVSRSASDGTRATASSSGR